ncbi:MAG: hypothetical protein JNK72_07200 [Myxococcales bacterium]|nr:hypothetical protein [Myxococcales bacterium]
MSLAGVAGCGSTVNPGAGPVDGGADGGAGPADGAAVEAGVEDVGVDVPPMPVDIGPLGEGQQGERCESDNECASGVCVTGGDFRRICSVRCAVDDTCFLIGGNYNCAVERPEGDASRARAVCAISNTPPADAPAPCEADSACTSNLCVDGHCSLICTDDSQCTAGLRCGAVAGLGGGVRACRPTPISGVTVEDFALFQGDSRVDQGTAELKLVAPSDTVSVTWITQDTAGSNLFAAVSRVTSPSNRALVDLRTFSYLNEQPIRTLPARFQVGVALLPSSNTLDVEPGLYRSQHILLNNQGSAVTTRGLRAIARVKRAPGGRVTPGWTLRVRFVFVGLSSITAATAQTNARLAAGLREMTRIFAQVGVNLQVTNYDDISGPTAQRLAIIDSRAELQEAYTLTSPFSGDVLPIIMVRGISSSAGLENAIGIAGSIAGPPGIHGTVQSGVVVGWESTQGFGRDVLAITMAHECGHFLGLWHTRERLPACTSNTQMECSPFGAVDPISDTPTTAAAEANLMYYSANGGTVVSPGQGNVLLRNPLVR